MAIDFKNPLRFHTGGSGGAEFQYCSKLPASLDLPRPLLDRLGAFALSRGVQVVTVIKTSATGLNYVRLTCKAMVVPLPLLEYIEDNGLDWDKNLGQPEYLAPGADSRVYGDGKVFLLKGVEVQPEVHFITKAGSPIIIGANCTLLGPSEIQAGTILQPGALLDPRL